MYRGFKVSYDSANVLRTPRGVGIAIAFSSENPSNYCAVVFGISVGNSINITKIGGNLDVGSVYNNQGTWIVSGANGYVIIGL